MATVLNRMVKPPPLSYCWPKKAWERAGLAVFGLIVTLFFLISLYAQLIKPTPHFVLTGALLIFFFFCVPVGQLTKIAKTLRFINCPYANEALTKVLTYLSLIWLTTCIGVHIILAADLSIILLFTGLLVMAYSYSFYEPADFPEILYIFLPYLFLALANRWLDWANFALVIFGLACLSVRKAILAWQNPGKKPSKSNDAINRLRGKNNGWIQLYFSTPAIRNNNKWLEILHCYRFFGLRWHLLALVVILLVGAFNMLWNIDPTPYEEFLFICGVANFLMVQQQMVGLYVRKKERSLLSTLPGMPKRTMQAKYLRTEYWQRLAIPPLLFVVFGAISSLGEPEAVFPYLTIAIFGLLAVRITETKLACFAKNEKTGLYLGLFTPVATIVAGVFCALIGDLTRSNGIVFLFAAVIFQIALLLLPRMDNSDLALAKRD